MRCMSTEGIPTARRTAFLVLAAVIGLIAGVLAVVGLVVAIDPGKDAPGWTAAAMFATFFVVAGATGAGVLKLGPKGQPVPAPDPTREEKVYAAVRAALQQPTSRPSPVSNALLFVGTFALFALTQGTASGPSGLIILVGVLLFHEAGHWVGMKLFRYDNVKVFFVPFLGAATSGVRREAAPWKEGVVLLLGPVPGLVVGTAMALSLNSSTSATVYDVALMLVWLNAFNLLPLTALDGGRLVNLVLFSRHRVLEAIFMTVASLAMGALAFALHSWILGIIAYFGLFWIRASFAAAGASTTIQQRWPALPEQLEQATDELQLALFQGARSMSNVRRFDNPNVTINWMRTILSRANDRHKHPSLAISVVLLGAYAAAIVLSLYATIVLARTGT
jgi:Zn-dependent protease